MPKVQGQQHIHCSVENCNYYEKGNICTANEIMVMGDSQGSEFPDRVDHGMAAQIPAFSANSCMSTCCKTFVDKNSDKTGVDATFRLPTQS